ncbi:pentapeptide repeat-containing protein [Streptomyces sp. NPDC006458]|uniref:pentapeptide repeat-containing protein n=1 Tax=Streptomyces sp. NPDC006458 TaxID=3154302 RepID=UPI0033B6D89F
MQSRGRTRISGSGERPRLNAKLSGADLRGADLRGANLTNADLSNANLAGTKREGAIPTGANLDAFDKAREAGPVAALLACGARRDALARTTLPARGPLLHPGRAHAGLRNTPACSGTTNVAAAGPRSRSEHPRLHGGEFTSPGRVRVPRLGPRSSPSRRSGSTARR